MYILKTGYGGSGKAQRGLRTSHRYQIYCKIPIISPVLIFVQRLFSWAYFRVAHFRRGLLLEGIMHFKMCWT